MLKTITLTLDVEKGDDRFATLDERIELRQGDALAYALEVSLREKSEVIDLTGKAVRFYCQLPDGSVAIDGGHVSVPSPQDGVIRYEIPPEITQTAGNIDMAYFRITDEDPESRWSASTPNIPLSIRRGIAIKLRDGDYFPEFDAALADLEASRVAYEQAEDARQAAEAARATAEEARAAAELLRLTAEEGRDAAEAERLAAELERGAAELDRLAAEEEREAAEEDRALAELGREEAEAYRRAKFAEIEELADGLLYYFCADGEYDPDTRHPIIAEPHAGTHYLTPASHPTANNHWDEWLWDAAGQRWEGYGSQDVVIDPMTVEQAQGIFDGDQAEGTEGEIVTRRILRWVLGKLDGLYAKLAHTHSGADLTDGTVTAAKLASGAVTQAKIADGSVSLAKCDTALRHSVSHKLVTVGAVGSIGTLYRWGNIGIIEIYLLQKTSIAAWGNVSATLPGGIKTAVTARNRLTCEDKPGNEVNARVADGTLYIENRTSAAVSMPASGGYISGSVVFPIL